VRKPPAPQLPPAAAVIAGSLLEDASLAKLLEGCDAVVHCAGAIKAIDADTFDQVNRAGAARMAEEARRSNIPRFVLISSLAARAPLLSAYAASKRAGEAAVADALGDRALMLRPPVVYGPGDKETLPMFQAARIGLLPVPGPRDARLSFLHVADFADAVVSALRASALPAGLFEIDDGKERGYGWTEIVEALGAALGRRPIPLFLPRRGMDLAGRAGLALARLTGQPMMLRPDKVEELRHPDWVCRGPRLGDRTGWLPRFNLASGFTDAADWYRVRRMLW
jgi:nucleoside-diphosphate-sugar epimerase